MAITSRVALGPAAPEIASPMVLWNHTHFFGKNCQLLPVRIRVVRWLHQLPSSGMHSAFGSANEPITICFPKTILQPFLVSKLDYNQNNDSVCARVK